MTKAEGFPAIDVPDRRMLRIGERRRTLLKRYSGRSDAIFARTIDAAVLASTGIRPPSLSIAYQ